MCIRVFAALAACLLSTALTAGSGVWSPTGPYNGGGMLGIEADNAVSGRFYATTINSVFRTDNGGTSWMPVNTGLTQSGFVDYKLETHPVSGGVVYVGGTNYVWKTTDAGGNWLLHSTGLPADNSMLSDEQQELHELVTVPSRPNWIFALTGNGLYKSTNAGMSWSQTGFTERALRLGVDPSNPDTMVLAKLFLPGDSHQIFRSTDGGMTWNSIDSAMPSGHNLGDRISDIRFTDYSGTVLMVGDNGRYRSTDAGSTWSLQPGANGGNIAVDPTNSSRIILGQTLQESTNGGMNWSLMSTVPRGPQGRPAVTYSLAFDPFNPNRRLVATIGGIYRQTSGSGSPWSKMSSGIDAINVRALAVNPDNPDHVLAGQERGFNVYAPVIYRSTNGGTTWSAATMGMPAAAIRALEMDTTTSSSPSSTVVYAGGTNLYPGTDSGGGLVPSDGGLYKSTDGGQTWSVMDNGLPVVPGDQYQENVPIVRDIELRPDSASGGSLQTIYAALQGAFDDNGSGGVVQDSARVYKSTDAGMSWSASDSGIPDPTSPDGFYPAAVQLIIDPSNNDVMYLSTFLSGGFGMSGPPTIDNGVFKSTDGGSTWTHMSSGLPHYDPGNTFSSHSDVLSLAMDPGNSSVLYASVNDLDADPVETDLYKTTDGASTWNQLTGLPATIGDIRDIRVNSNGTVYIANAQSINSPGAIWYSDDGGTSWNSLSAGLSSRAISTKLSVDEDSSPTRLYAGTGRSVWRFDVVTDSDGDGVPDSAESAGPGGGDANGDGTADSMQSNVASFVGNATTRGLQAGYITVEVTPVQGDCSVINDAISPADDALPVDAGRSQPHGVARFDIADCEIADVRLIFHAAGDLDATPWTFRNYGPTTPGDDRFIWYDYSGDLVITGNQVEMTLADGAFGDIRGADDRILFQGGPSTLAEMFFRDGFEVN